MGTPETRTNGEVAGRFVAVANGQYSTHQPLERAVPDALALASLLEEQYHFETVVLPDLERGALLDALDQALAAAPVPADTLLVAWTGHGEIAPDGTLHLIGRTAAGDRRVATAADLGEWVARTGAQQVLLLIDTCFSGAGVVDAARLASAVQGTRSEPGNQWFGVLAASLGDEEALSGALAREVRRLLTEGPRIADLRWERLRPRIRGDDFIQMLVSDWCEPRQTPYPLSLGRARDFVRNPRYAPGASAEVVEHLLVAARGTSGEGNFFVGRERTLASIVEWLRAGEPGLCVVTGPPGSGKSAIVGRIVSLSAGTERQRILNQDPVPASLDPGENAVDLQLHARGMTLDTAAEELLRQLGMEKEGGHFALLAEARRRHEAGKPLVVAIDGLDEARAFSAVLATELLAILAGHALVLVGTRDVAGANAEPLLKLLGPAALTIDIGQEGDATRADIQQYVQRRLQGIDPRMDPTAIADELTRIADAPSDASFLLARLVTSQLRERPVDTSSEGWQQHVASSVEMALDHDLDVAVLDVGGHPHPTAAREILRALALAHGSGFPADDVWPTVASRLSRSGTTYDREDVYRCLALFGRHVIAGNEGDQPVYRLAHQHLVDYLAGRRSAGGDPASDENRRLIASAIAALYDSVLDRGTPPRGHTYLWRYAWRHMAEAGADGLPLLEALVARDRDAFLPDLAAGLELLAEGAITRGDVDTTITLQERIVEIRRELADPMRLATSLFQLSLAQLIRGDPASDATAEEGLEVGRSVSETPELRAVLSAALLSRALSHMRNARYHGAKRLAEEALALAQPSDGEEDQASALRRAQVMLVLAKTESSLGDVDAASETLTELLNQYATRGPLFDDLRADALATLAGMDLILASQGIPTEDGKPRRAFAMAAREIWETRAQTRGSSASSQLDGARGLLFAAQAVRLDAIRGATDAWDPSEPVEALGVVIDIAERYAHAFADSALIKAAALRARALMATDIVSAGNDALAAVETLRPLAAESPIVRSELAEALHQLNAIKLATPDGLADLDEWIARQREAIALLRKDDSVLRRPFRLAALSQLTNVLRATGRTKDVGAASAEAIAVGRQLEGRMVETDLQLAALLSDESSFLLATAPLLAAPVAAEALEIAERLPGDVAKNIGAAASLNLAAARINLDQLEGTDALLWRAVDVFRGSSSPLAVQNLGVAHLNLALHAISSHRYADAIPLAEEALQRLQGPAGSVPTGAHANAHLVLGIARRGAGDSEGGQQLIDEILNPAIESFREGTLAGAGLSALLNTAGSADWERALARLDDRPDVRRMLVINRRRPPEELDQTVHALVDGLDEAVGEALVEVHAIARLQRMFNAAHFDEIWRREAGDLPPWLLLDVTKLSEVVMWVNTPTWEYSRDYLTQHQELLAPETDVALREMALGMEEEGASIIDLHLEVLARARTQGIRAAFEPVIASQAINAWVQSDDLEAHLDEHPELLDASVSEELRRRGDADGRVHAVLAAILELARRGEQALAFRLDEDAAFAHAQFESAWPLRDPERFMAMATIVQYSADDPALKRQAFLALAVTEALQGHADRAMDWLGAALEDSTAEERAAMTARIGEVIAQQPASAAALAQLITRVVQG